MHRPLLAVAILLVAGSACTTLKGEMRQAESAYDQANYEDAIRWFEALESDEPRMKANDRARYHYLRGMSSYRLGKRDDALYYLSLAREIVAHEGATLDDDQMSEMEAVLEELTPTGAGYHAREEGGEDEIEDEIEDEAEVEDDEELEDAPIDLGGDSSGGGLSSELGDEAPKASP